MKLISKGENEVNKFSIIIHVSNFSLAFRVEIVMEQMQAKFKICF